MWKHYKNSDAALVTTGEPLALGCILYSFLYCRCCVVVALFCSVCALCADSEHICTGVLYFFFCCLYVSVYFVSISSGILSQYSENRSVYDFSMIQLSWERVSIHVHLCASLCVAFILILCFCVLKGGCVYFHGDGSRLKQLMRHVRENLFVFVVVIERSVFICSVKWVCFCTVGNAFDNDRAWRKKPYTMQVHIGNPW